MSLFWWKARTGLALPLGVALVLGILGCGADQYETRLKESAKYYAFLEQIELNLAPKWSDNAAVEFIRVPKQFQPIPAPVPVKNEAGETEVPPDVRQPDYLNLVFPSNQLIGAWEAPFNVDTSDGSTDVRKGYIYVLSNYWMFLGEDPSLALKFTGGIVQLVGDALDDHIPPDKLENPEIGYFPKRGQYMPEVAYSVFTYQPKPITLRNNDRETTVNYTFTMYARQNGNVQAIVLVALPDRISSQEKLTDRVRMMLENFRVNKTEPRGGTQGGSGGGGPAQNNSNPF
jgi:hypothetical protein